MHISSQTVASWRTKHQCQPSSTLSTKEKGASLSYLQLIEVAVVSSFRKSGISLRKIKAAREYLGKQFEAEHPFAEFRSQTEGKELWLDYAQFEAEAGDKTLLTASQNGPLAWTDIIGRLQEFEYEDHGLAVKWHVNGADSDIVIDPRVQFGAPAIDGVATGCSKGAGRPENLLMKLPMISECQIRQCYRLLKFEGVDTDGGGNSNINAVL